MSAYSALQKCLSLWRTASRLRQTMQLLIASELIAVFVLPRLVPGQWYFERYQSDARAALAVRSFFSADHCLLPDPQVGWLNRPGFFTSKTCGTDGHGSRSQQPFGVTREAGKARVMFLGSSMVNGGAYVNGTETISAYAATSTVETLNFGTMLYRIDQSYIAYKVHLAKFDPDIVIVGVDEYADSPVSNVWIPLVSRTEVNLPFVKPRFRLIDGEIVAELAPLDLLRMSAKDPLPLLSYVAQHDDLYFVFDDAKRFGLTPIAHTLNYVYRTTQRMNLRWVDGPPSRGEQLTLSILEHFRDELHKQRKKLILLLLPRSDAIGNKPWKSDYRSHQRMRELLAARGLFYVDAVDALRKLPVTAGFGTDGIHYSPKGNRAIAEQLAPFLSSQPEMSGAR